MEKHIHFYGPYQAKKNGDKWEVTRICQCGEAVKFDFSKEMRRREEANCITGWGPKGSEEWTKDLAEASAYHYNTFGYDLIFSSEITSVETTEAFTQAREIFAEGKLFA